MIYNKKYPVNTLLIFVAGLIFLPGLSSIFLLDDFPNLSRLSNIESIADWKNIISYAFNGLSSSLGRPVSLLSFALQSGAWPNDAYLFKLVNILIHLINGLLIYIFSHQLLSIGFPDKQNIQPYALVTSILWIIHPLQVSTVLYVVQRMTELSALFTLTGLILYIKGRMVGADWKRSHLWMTTGICIGLLFGILSKENAILICAFILTMEWTILRSIPKPKYWNIWAFIFTIMPLLALGTYLAPGVARYFAENYPTRNFSALTRLLTEARIVVDYLLNILLPRPNSFGLFNSDYSVSRDLFTPISTFWSGLFILSLLTVAIKIRKIFPYIAFGVLWFFTGHLLESTVLGLELYFEHRNYLPLFGIILAVICSYIAIKQKLENKQYHKGKISISTGMFLWVLLLAFITFNETRLWGNPVYQASIWAEQHPNSYRAQGHYVELLTKFEEFEIAKKLLEKNTHVFNQDSTQILHWLNLTCYSEDIEGPGNDLILNKTAASRYFNASLTILDEIITLKERNKCGRIDNNIIEKILLSLLKNENFKSTKASAHLYVLLARTNIMSEQYSDAVQNFSYAYQRIPSIDILLYVTDIHLRQGNKQWYMETMDLVDQFCIKSPVKCLRNIKDIEKYHEILTHINNTHSNN